MCTAILSIEPGAPLLLAGVRDELFDRAWQPPGRHWPDHPRLIGGLDLQAGGTWLAVAPELRRVGCVLNARGRMAPQASRRSRGVLPLLAAEQGKLEPAGLADFDPFHVLSAEPERAVMWSWDGRELAERELGPGVHMVVNSGVDGDLRGARDHERERVCYFLPLFREAERPVPGWGGPAERAWGAWLPLLNGGGLSPADPRALIVRREIASGRAWGTTSISLVALSPGGLRYDFTAAPGDPAAWQQVPVAAA
jgi:hypothetical protein